MSLSFSLKSMWVPVVYFFFQMVVMNELCHTTQVRTLEGRGGVPVNGQKSRQGIGIEMIWWANKVRYTEISFDILR
jgi:hypothetical protein